MTEWNHGALSFARCRRRRVRADSSGGSISPNGGALLSHEVDRQLGLTDRVARAVGDRRPCTKVRHEVVTMVRQRVHEAALGYEYLNDHDALRHDEAVQTACERDAALASASTLCRAERSRTEPGDGATAGELASGAAGWHRWRLPPAGRLHFDESGRGERLRRPDPRRMAGHPALDAGVRSALGDEPADRPVEGPVGGWMSVPASQGDSAGAVRPAAAGAAGASLDACFMATAREALRSATNRRWRIRAQGPESSLRRRSPASGPRTGAHESCRRARPSRATSPSQMLPGGPRLPAASRLERDGQAAVVEGALMPGYGRVFGGTCGAPSG